MIIVAKGDQRTHYVPVEKESCRVTPVRRYYLTYASTH